MTAEQIAKLPKWAQSRISVLEANLAYERAENAVISAGESNTWIEANEPTFGTRIYLPPNAMVCFKLRNGDEVSAYVRRDSRDDHCGKLDINSKSGSILVEPRAANSVYITTDN